MSTCTRTRATSSRAGRVARRATACSTSNKYTFVVRPDANKTEIKIAVEKIFDVKVTREHAEPPGQDAGAPAPASGKRADTKRAIVTLAEGHRIDIFGGPVA